MYMYATGKSRLEDLSFKMAELLQVLEDAQQIEVYDERTEEEHMFTESSMESPSKKRHPNHHVGPIDVSYAEDSQRRCKSFFKRRKTIFDKANQLTSICGASVSIKLKSQGGQVYEYKSGEYQQEAGIPMTTIQPGPAPRGRPRKKPDKEEESPDHDTQGSSMTYLQVPIKKAPCNVCKKTDSWLTCHKPGCTFWAHARCLGFVTMTPIDMSNVKFFCPKHIPSS